MRPQPFHDEEGGGHANSGGKGAKHARGEWSSGLCDCTGDWCSCLSVFCCGAVTTAQLCTRCDPCLTLVHPKGTGTVPGSEHHPAPIRIARRFFGGRCPPALLCVLIFIFLIVANISYWTNYNSMQTLKYGLPYLVFMRGHYRDDKLQQAEGELQQFIVLSLLVCLGSLFTCLTVCQARRATP